MTEVNKTHAVCGECGAEFDYVLKKGYPRKYCDVCKPIKKAEFEGRDSPGVPIEQPVPVEKVGGLATPEQATAVGNMRRAEPTSQDMTHLNCKIMCAKDIFCVIAKENVGDNKDWMSQATALVKQAKEELQ